MGVHSIIEQMGKPESTNQAKNVTLEKWLNMTPN
jgi:hypothetical protein